MFSPSTTAATEVTIITPFTSSSKITLSEDMPPAINAKQYAVTTVTSDLLALGITSHSISLPYTVTFKRPMKLSSPLTNSAGKQVSNPMNTYSIVVRKALNVDGNTPPRTAVGRITTTFDIPAGAETFDHLGCKLLFSTALGMTYDQRLGILDTIITGLA